MKKSTITLQKRKRIPKIFKNDQLTKASFQKYSLGSYRITLMLNEKFHKETKAEEDLVNFFQKKQYVITAEEYSQKFSTSKSVSCRVLNHAVDILINSNIELDSEHSRLKINFCSYANYLKNQGILLTVFTKEILPFIAQSAKRYTLYNLNDVVCFKSLYSIRLFELIQGFKYSGWMVKTIDELRVIFNTGPKLLRYDNFKRKTFFRAINEINKYHTHLELKFEEIYNGRKVKSIKFLFRPAVKEVGQDAYNPEEIPDLLPIPNIKPLDKYEVKEKLRLAAERKEKREQKKFQKQIKAIVLSKEEEIALKLLQKKSSMEVVEAATGVSKTRLEELCQLVFQTKN